MGAEKVLVAEDDTVTQRLLQSLLEKLGYMVLVAPDGQRALELYESEHPRVIISDWMMPQMDGLTLCKRIRERHDPQYTYYILLTSRNSKENYREAMRSEVDDFLSKPLESDELVIRLWVADRILSYTTRIRQLEEILPVCSYCRKVRDEDDAWYGLDQYLTRPGRTSFSHGICPECYQTHARPALDKLKKGKNPG